MQALNARVQQIGTGARPASGSAFLTGHVVTVTVPTLTMSNDMLAIGGEWTETKISEEDYGLRALINHALDGTRQR